MVCDFRRGLRRVRVVASVLVGLVGLVSPAMAQTDRPFNWTGLYGGVNLGVEFLFGSGNANCITPAGVPTGTACNFPANVPTSSTGIAGGVQAGYLYQYDRVVGGFEVDLSGLSAVSNSTTAHSGNLNGTSIFSSELNLLKQQVDWLVTVRPRLGYAFDRVLVYGTGGLAVGGTRMETNMTFTCVGCTANYPGSGQTTMLGYAVGGGVEYAFADRWSVRSEALYWNLGTQNVYAQARPTTTGFLEGFSGYFQGIIARVAANYRF
jgi:outer membrane immunogenic protein